MLGFLKVFLDNSSPHRVQKQRCVPVVPKQSAHWHPVWSLRDYWCLCSSPCGCDSVGLSCSLEFGSCSISRQAGGCGGRARGLCIAL
jgi:hypothetical protein